jgi:hypothetical protein
MLSIWHDHGELTAEPSGALGKSSAEPATPMNLGRPSQFCYLPSAAARWRRQLISSV